MQDTFIKLLTLHKKHIMRKGLGLDNEKILS